MTDHVTSTEALTRTAAVFASAADALDPALYALARPRMAHLLGVDDAWRPAERHDRRAHLPAWPTSELFDRADRAVLTMAEQFVLDVSEVDDEQRAMIRAAMGPDAPVLVNVLYAIDVELRLRAAYAQLFGIDPFERIDPGPLAPLPDALNLMTRDIARLDALDPLTTELVRLRGARIHNCRMCQALRHADALAAGGDEEMFARIDDHASGGFDERHELALALTDAVLMSPGEFPSGLASRLHEHFGDDELAEIVLDVERNARNKIAVANATDGDGVGEGLTVYATPGGGFELVSTGPGVSDPRGRF
ncbi:hypothetical protein ncot_07680 [Nocardioides sp. JQ2195]|uniref:carboxymuconolactone decarboxylase family protein n=1 Tax=Nocardioides sp. JQ2195 TaxID=2592334 RepID=UPI00143E7D85|nr:hypothetical protein [Nocardioides sp. JQ2195]QIX26498.1 hypothetical protein ncot_07680 [Nocardioides sp. JQ2195]